MSKIHMMAIYTVKPGKEELVGTAVKEFIEGVKENEPGALFYEAYKGREDLSFFHVMTFENSLAEEFHRHTPHMAAFVQKLFPNCEEEPGFVELEMVGSNVR